MRGYRKVFLTVFMTVAYVLGSKWTGMGTQGGVYVTMLLAGIGGNAIEHLPKVMEKLTPPSK